MRSAIVLLTTGIVILVDSGWWLAATVVSGIILFGIAHYAERRRSPHRAGWYE